VADRATRVRVSSQAGAQLSNNKQRCTQAGLCRLRFRPTTGSPLSHTADREGADGDPAVTPALPHLYDPLDLAASEYTWLASPRCAVNPGYRRGHPLYPLVSHLSCCVYVLPVPSTQAPAGEGEGGATPERKQVRIHEELLPYASRQHPLPWLLAAVAEKCPASSELSSLPSPPSALIRPSKAHEIWFCP
jgi:hypothetical protein